MNVPEQVAILQQIADVVGRQKEIWRTRFDCLPASLQEMIQLHDQLPEEQANLFCFDPLENRGNEGSVDQ